MQRRNWLGLSILVLVTMFALGGCSNGGNNNSNLTTTPADPTPPPSGVGLIQGIVRDYDTNAPVAGATIRVFDSSENDLGTATTDADGNFTIEIESGLDHFIDVTADGFHSVVYYGIDVEDDQTTILNPVLALGTGYSGNGTITGFITDATNNNPVAGAVVALRRGINNQAGPTEGGTESGGGGGYTINNFPIGVYTAEVSQTGYITAYATVYCIDGEVIPNQNIVLSPVLAAGQMRIVLTWGANPSDLDSHLTGPTTSGPRFHVYYSDESVNDGTVANLDVDDTTSYGPETITLTQAIGGTYRYYVHDFTNDGASAAEPSYELSNSGAQVKVYDSTGLVATYNVPAGVGGTLWEVFSLVGNVITPVNVIDYRDPFTNLP